MHWNRWGATGLLCALGSACSPDPEATSFTGGGSDDGGDTGERPDPASTTSSTSASSTSSDADSTLSPDTTSVGSSSSSATDGTSSAGPSDETGSPLPGSSGEGDSSTTTGDGAVVCETVVCGVPGECCDVGLECVLGECLAPCDSGVRCGESQDVCCGDGEVCLGEECVAPRASCADSFDCELQEFCEPTLESCLPQFDPVACELIPAFENIEVLEEWAWTDEQVISLPVVADIDGDGGAEVVLNLTRQGGDWVRGRIAVLDGRRGTLKWDLQDDPDSHEYGSQGRATIGLSDVSGDGLPDIIYAGRNVSGSSIVHAVDGFGNHLWSSHDQDGDPYALEIVNGAVSFGNFDDDPESEIVFGASLIDHDGRVVWDQGGVGATFGTNGSYSGGISAIADLDGDGQPEIVSGRHAWAVAWEVVDGAPSVDVTPFWDAGSPDGYPAIADLDQDGDPEVILVANGTVRVLNGGSGRRWCGIDPSDAACLADDSLRTHAVAIPGSGIGGPPTIADFDGDGRPEIAAAGGSSYTVYDIARPGEDIVVADGFDAPSAGDLYPRWTRATQDQSSNATGSSVFDFQGDGAAEVVYADECYMRIYDGATGDVILEQANSSGTIHEYPLVVDVDHDGNSEIIVVANESGNNCGAIEGYEYRRGLYVYGDQFDRWVGTRRVWTSHTYHVTNANSAGNFPESEVDNWTQPSLNNYRQNVQGEGAFNAPDLAVELTAALAECSQGRLRIVARVRNQGALGVAAGVPVSLHAGEDAQGALIGTQTTQTRLLPGQQTELEWVLDFPIGSDALALFVTVDGEDGVGSRVAECDESNNHAASASVACHVPG